MTGLSNLWLLLLNIMMAVPAYTSIQGSSWCHRASDPVFSHVNILTDCCESCDLNFISLTSISRPFPIGMLDRSSKAQRLLFYRRVLCSYWCSFTCAFCIIIVMCVASVFHLHAAASCALVSHGMSRVPSCLMECHSSFLTLRLCAFGGAESKLCSIPAGIANAQRTNNLIISCLEGDSFAIANSSFLLRIPAHHGQ